MTAFVRLFDFVRSIQRSSISFVRFKSSVRFRSFDSNRLFDFVRSISFVKPGRQCPIAAFSRAVSSIDGSIVCGNP